MSRVIDDSVEAILLVHEAVQNLKNLDGLKSSVSLLPESLMTPYKAPLGN